jgi:flagellar hook-length control protein FliK
MIVRAAGAGMQRNVDLATVQSAAPSEQLARGATPTPASSSTASPQSMTEKMTMLLTEAISAAAGTSQEHASAQDDALRDSGTNAGDSVVPLKAARTDLLTFSLPNVPSPVTSASTQSQTAATANPPADPSAAVEQLISSMTMRTSTDGTSEVRLRLQPESLGTVTLKLTVDGNNVSANVVAQNGEARTALLAGQQHLARSLADSGLKLSSFTVDVSGGQTHDQNRDQTSGFGRKYTVHEAAATDADSPDGSSVGPELLSGSTLGLLSYLA